MAHLHQRFYNYNADNSIQNVTDARGVVTNYLYDPQLGLLTSINYNVPTGLPIMATPNVSFTYEIILATVHL